MKFLGSLDSTPLSPTSIDLSDTAFRAIRRFIVESGDKAFGANRHERANLKKTASDITTAWDVSIERSFAELIREFCPDHGFLGEEDATLNLHSEYSWYIDPIDGTHYFSSGVPLWSIAIALVLKGQPIISLIYNPATGDLYEAQRGQGTFLNSERLPDMSRIASNSRGRFVWDYVEWKGVPENKLAQAEKVFYSLRKLFDEHITICSGSLALAFLSQGAFTAFVDPYRRKSKYVDIAAGLLMASEVGYEVHRASLSDVAEEFIVARPDVVGHIKKCLAEHMRGD